jgi:hypothetical protein
MMVVAPLALVAPAAQAADAPRLTSFSVSATSVVAPAEVALSYTASTAPDSAQAVYVHEAGGQARIVTMAAGTSGSGLLKLPDGVRNGRWTLDYVSFSSGGDLVFTCRLGSSRSCAEYQDFSAYDVTLSGSDWDVTAPIVDSVTPPAVPVRPGESYTVAWDAADAHPLASMAMRFQNKAPEARGHQFTVSTTNAAALAAEQVTAVLPASSFDGSYVLTQISVKDTLGNTAAYLPDGTVVPSNGATQPKSHGLTFSAIAVPVAGSTQDVTPPVLTALTADRSTVESQNPVRFSYASNDPSHVTAVSIELKWPSGHLVTASKQAPVTDSGAFDAWWFQEVGVTQVTKVVLTDAQSNTIEYRRDGTTYNPLTKVTGTHAINFAALDVTVTPARVLVVADAHSHMVKLSWDNPRQGPNVTSYRVVASPGGALMDVPALDSSPMSVTFRGLQNSVTYTFTVTPQSTGGPGPTVKVTALPLISMNVWAAGDVNGDRRNDLLATLRQPEDTNSVRLYRGTNGPGFGSRRTVETVEDRFTGFPRTSLDGLAAYLTLKSGSYLYLNTLNRSGHLDWLYGGVPGWGVRFLDGSADFSGDGVGDVIAVRHDGSAYLYRGAANGYDYGKGARIATGWGTMQTVFAATDVTGDRRADLLGVDSAGVLWIYPGTGKGTFTAKRKVSGGWGGLGALFNARDVTGDGKVDLAGITMDGTLRIYRGRGNGTFTSATTVSSGWGSYL